MNGFCPISITCLASFSRSMKITIAEFSFSNISTCLILIVVVIITCAVISRLVIGALRRKIENTTDQLKTELALRKIAEQEAIAAKEQLDGMFNVTTDFVALIDEEGLFIHANQALADYFGRSLEQLTGTSFYCYYPDEIAQEKRRIVKRILSTGTSERFEQQENDHYLDCSFFPMKAQGRPEPLLALFMRDITHYQGLMNERERTSRVLRDMNTELEGIIRIASHDLKTPLVTINGFAGELASSCRELVDLLGECDKPNPMKEKVQNIIQKDILVDVDLIKAGTCKVESLVSSLLKLARVGHKKPQTEPIDMIVLVKKILKSMAYQIKESDVRIQVDPLPECLGDEAMINQVMTNLISNAIKYRHKSRPVQIQVSAQEKADRCIYCIEDNGIGVSRDYQEKIFELFYRMDPEKGEGEGLGLSIVRGIVTRHNGRIWLESEPDQGSRFYVSLPNLCSA